MHRPDDAGLDGTKLQTLINEELWPLDKAARWGKIGIAPIGTPALHRPTSPVITPSAPLAAFSTHMIAAMNQAGGIGLAANQVAISARVLVHNLPRVAPQILVNAVIIESEGSWQYSEGCLSVEIEGTRASLVRPNRILLAAETLDGGYAAISAAELFGRVLQHELDHLDGIEYVQRLTGSERGRVYSLMAGAGVDVACVPYRPYAEVAR
jgi:peptide deformylase